MDSGERGMNPVAMTIINPRKGFGQARGSYQRPPVLKSCTLPTEHWGSPLFVGLSFRQNTSEPQPSVGKTKERHEYVNCSRDMTETKLKTV